MRNNFRNCKGFFDKMYFSYEDSVLIQERHLHLKCCMESIVCALSIWLFEHYVSTLGEYWLLGVADFK